MKAFLVLVLTVFLSTSVYAAPPTDFIKVRGDVSSVVEVAGTVAITLKNVYQGLEWCVYARTDYSPILLDAFGNKTRELMPRAVVMVHAQDVQADDRLWFYATVFEESNYNPTAEPCYRISSYVVDTLPADLTPGPD